MNATIGQERRADKKNGLLEHLRNPTQLRFFLTVIVLGIAYAAVYAPLDDRIRKETKKRAELERRLSLAGDVARLRGQFKQIERRLPGQVDADEWVQYVLAAIRRSPLKLDSFSPNPAKPLGPCQIFSLSLRLSGSLADVDQFLAWLESDERLFRVEKLNLVPRSHDGEAEFDLDIIVAGMMG
jgi:Tfp pilus assembly protein PilO